MERKFRMQKRKKPTFKIVSFFIIILAGIVVSRLYITHPTADYQQVANVDTNEIRLTKDSAIKTTNLYSCGHKRFETRKVDNNLIGKTKNEISKIHKDWIITDMTYDLLTVEVHDEKTCDNHYIISLKDKNKICAFKKNDPTVPIHEVEIDVLVLTQNDITELTNGITANSEYEMLEILESFSQ